MDDSIDLGNNYRYIQDYPQTIIYHTDKYEGIGSEIIPPIVLSYKFDDLYIIAKSQLVNEANGSIEGLPILYWIIDKSKKGSNVEPMDSLSFYKKLIELDIHLKL